MSERDPFSVQATNSNNPPDYGATAAAAAIPNVSFADFSPTEMFNLSENIDKNICSINSSLKSLEKMKKQIGGQQDNQLLRDKIENSLHTINSLINMTKRDLQRLGEVVKRGEKRQKLGLERLVSAFNDSLKAYIQVRQAVSEQLQAHIPMPIQSRNNSNLVEIDDEQVAILEQKQAQASKLKFDTAMLEERETRMMQIEGDVIDIQGIMVDIARLVDVQKEVVDNVESHIEEAANNVETGRAELVKAERYQNKFRRKMIILLVIALIVAIILAVIIVKSVK